MLKNILQLLEASEEQFPEKTAYADLTEALTYREFTGRAKAIGSEIAARGIRNRPVAVLIDRSVACLSAMMGVLYSGNFYTVLDTAMPKDRMDVILHTLSPVMLLTLEKSREKAEGLGFSGEILVLEELLQAPVEESVLVNIRRHAVSTDPAYVLFTSGSTGVPKGTVVSHGSVIAYVQWVREEFSLSSETIFGSQTPFYFSMSVLDIYSTMLVGATFYIIPKMYFSFPLRLVEMLNEKKINTIYWVPSALCIVANLKVLDEYRLPDLRKILFAGEVMPVRQLNIWIDHMDKDVLFANLYGPTEVTDICTFYKVNRRFSEDESLPIGGSCDNCDVLVLREDGTEADFGEVGELCVRGPFLGMGYYGNHEKTEQAFTQNPLNPYYPERIYRTGDLVCYNEYGELLYLSRKDFQIKHMGYRIELGEIETAVYSLDGVIACACVYDAARAKIRLFYQAAGLQDTDILGVCKAKLPPYMIPNALIRLDVMPHNANGKIDRPALKKYKPTEKV